MGRWGDGGDEGDEGDEGDKGDGGDKGDEGDEEDKNNQCPIPNSQFPIPMKTDTIFYKLFQEFPDIFFELIGKPETNPNIYEFQSQEIKETSFRLDGIFLTLETSPNEPIYFVEVQCYKDKLFYDRFLTSILLYFYQCEKAGEQGAGSRGEKPPTRGGASTKPELEQGGFCPQGARFVPFPLPSAPCPLPPAPCLLSTI